MLVQQMSKAAYTPRCYVVAATDKMSGSKALAKEGEWASSGAGGPSSRLRSAGSQQAGAGEASAGATVLVIPRSREVGQSYLTSVFTTLRSLAHAAGLVLQQRPQLVSGRSAPPLGPAAPVLPGAHAAPAQPPYRRCW